MITLRWARARFPATKRIPPGAVLLVPLACASAPAGSAPDLNGCYYFEQDAVFRQLRLPWGIRLHDEPLEGWPAMARRGARSAVTLTGTGEADHPFGYWIPLGSDSLEIGYPAGGGLVLDLEVDGHTLTGYATEAGDAMPPPTSRRDPAPARHPVTLGWARCP